MYHIFKYCGASSTFLKSNRLVQTGWHKQPYWSIEAMNQIQSHQPFLGKKFWRTWTWASHQRFAVPECKAMWLRYCSMGCRAGTTYYLERITNQYSAVSGQHLKSWRWWNTGYTDTTQFSVVFHTGPINYSVWTFNNFFKKFMACFEQASQFRRFAQLPLLNFWPRLTVWKRGSMVHDR